MSNEFHGLLSGSFSKIFNIENNGMKQFSSISSFKNNYSSKYSSLFNNIINVSMNKSNSNSLLSRRRNTTYIKEKTSKISFDYGTSFKFKESDSSFNILKLNDNVGDLKN